MGLKPTAGSQDSDPPWVPMIKVLYNTLAQVPSIQLQTKVKAFLAERKARNKRAGPGFTQYEGFNLAGSYVNEKEIDRD